MNVSISMIEPATAVKDGLGWGKLRALIAQHLGVGIERVTDDAHFADDFGADWLDRVELVIAIEDQFAGVEITDDDVDQIHVVGDLIRCVERPDSERVGAITANGRNATPVHKSFRPHRPRVEWSAAGSKSAAGK